MMNKFKLLALVMAILMIIPLVAACGLSDKPDDTAADTSDVETFIDIVKDGKAAKIVYAVDAEAHEKEMADKVKDSIFRNTGVTPECSYEMKYNASTVEIVIGDTTYPETEELRKTLKYGESAVKVMGNKIVVVGFDQASFADAITKLLLEFTGKLDANKNIAISSKFHAVVAPNEILTKVPVLEGWVPTITDTGDDCYMLGFGKDKTKFDKYITLLESNGFKLYAEKEIEENVYSTYTNDEVVVTTIFTKWNKTCKILVEWLKNTELPTKAEENKYTPIEGLKSSITQVGLFYDVQVDKDGAMTNFNGMCYVIRLADGSFIIADGGHAEIQADNLYSVLKAQAPDEDNITIAAWFFSHNHGDHTGFFTKFVEKYADKVNVEKFIYNFPSKEQGGYTTAQDTWKKLIKKELGATFIKAHPGQEFYIRNAKIDMLYTMDVYEDELKDTNNASIVWKMELEGKTFMCLGDYSENGKHLMNLYSSEVLGSDIVQMAHHGISGQNANIYMQIQPEYAFWPVGAKHVKFWSNESLPDLQLDTLAINSYFHVGKFDQSKIFWAFDDVVVMTLDDGTVSTKTYENVDNFKTNYKKIY